MSIFAIDPGPTESAFVVTHDDIWKLEHKFNLGSRGPAPEVGKIITRKLPNEEMFLWLSGVGPDDTLAIEMIKSFGMPVGAEVFDTVFWIGRFYQSGKSCGVKRIQLIGRMDVKMHHCHSSRANDANIRRSLIDKYGEPGTRRKPGLTHGLAGDQWSAFAIATYVSELIGCNIPAGGRDGKQVDPAREQASRC